MSQDQTPEPEVLTRMQRLESHLKPPVDPSSNLSEAIRVRLDAPTLARLDAFIAEVIRKNGRAGINRSTVLRLAIDEYLDALEAGIPELLNK